MAVEGDITAGARQCAVQHFHQLGTSRAHEARHAQDLALAQGKGHVVHTRAAEVIHLQADLTRRFIQMRILIFKLASHHHFDERIFRQRGHFSLGNKLPVAENGDVIADFKDLFHTVRDIDNPAPLRFQLADNAEQGFGFGIGQGVGRFIHNDDLRLEAQHLRDFHHLLIADGKVAHQSVALKAQIQLRQQFVRFGIHGFPVDFAKPVHELTAEEDVLRNGELRDQVQLLVDDADARFLRGFRAVEGGLFTQPQQRTGIALVDTGQHFHHGGFAGAVFAHQRHDAPGIDVQRRAGEGFYARERLIDPFELQ